MRFSGLHHFFNNLLARDGVRVQQRQPSVEIGGALDDPISRRAIIDMQLKTGIGCCAAQRRWRGIGQHRTFSEIESVVEISVLCLVAESEQDAIGERICARKTSSIGQYAGSDWFGCESKRCGSWREW